MIGACQTVKGLPIEALAAPDSIWSRSEPTFERLV
jgi:hypothetical protein